jgi:hypothetical protein
MPECPNCEAFDPAYERPFECDACGYFFPELEFRG